MNVIFLPVYKLLEIVPNAECSDCSKEAEDAPEEQIWVIYNKSVIYCPKCAEYEGFDTSDYE
jgi:hypothetical protein